MAEQQFGAAQPIADFFKHLIGGARKPSGGSETNAGKLPDAWERADEESVKRALASEKPRKRTKKRGTTMKRASSSATKGPSKRNSMQRKSGYGK